MPARRDPRTVKLPQSGGVFLYCVAMADNFLLGAITLLFGVGGLIAFIFFLVEQQRTLAAVRQKDRLMRPGRIWLQLIPVFGLIYQFVVTTRIAGSLRNERISSLSDSLMTDHDAPAVASTARPTLGIGLSFCITNLCFSIANFFNAFLTADKGGDLSAIFIIIGLSVVVFGLGCLASWIIYWVRLARARHSISLARARHSISFAR
jgi:hypothetical protein